MNTLVLHPYHYLAATYGEGMYGTDVYQSTSGTTTDPNSSTPGGGPLAETGYDVIIPVALGVSIIVASAILLAKRLIRKKQA